MARITPLSETQFSMIPPEDYPSEQDNAQQAAQQGRLSLPRPRFTPADRRESCEDGPDFISIERRELYLLSSFAAAFCRALSAGRGTRQARQNVIYAELLACYRKLMRFYDGKA